jgi:autotransporter-associated beta strand protein
LAPVSGTTSTFSQAGGGTLILNGIISSTGTIKLSLAGGGTFTLAGANTYSGGTTLASGTTLNINNSGSGGTSSAIGTAIFTINGGTIDNTTGTLVTLSTNNAIIVNGDFTFTGSNSLNLGTQGVTLTGNRAITVSASTLTFGGILNQTGGMGLFSLTKNGPGTLAFTQTASLGTLGGGITINGGTLSAASNNSLGTSGNVITINNGATFNNTGSMTASLHNFVLTSVASSTATFQTDAALSWSTPTASRLTGGSPTLTIVKSGVGQFTVTNSTGNSYTGNWRIDAGTLATSADAGLGNVANDITLNGGAFSWAGTGDYSPASTRTFTLNNVAGNTLNANSSTGSITLANTNQLTGSGGFTKTGIGTLNINASQDYSGGTTVNAGTLSVSSSGNLGATTGALAVNNPNTGAGTAVILNLNSAQTVGSLSGTIAAPSGGTNTATINLTGASTILTSNQSTDTSYAGVLAGTGGLTKDGAGTLVLSGANSYSGGTTVSAGLLQLKSNSALGSSSSSLTVNGGILDLNGQTISVGNLTGSGGTIWNNGPNSGTGTVTLTIGIGNTGGGTYAGLIQDNNPSSNAGKVALTKTGNGTITLSGANTYTGATTVNGGGTLFINGDQSAATGATTVTGAGTVLGGIGTIGGNVTVGGSNTATIIEGGTGSTGQTLTVKGSLTMQSGSIIELALGASAAHSTLALTAAGPTSFYLTQQFSFIDLGAQTATLYSGIITGVTSAVVTTGWTIDNPGWSGAFVWDAANNEIDLTLTAIPEPSTWIGAALALAVIGLMSRKRFAKRSRVIG